MRAESRSKTSLPLLSDTGSLSRLAESFEMLFAITPPREDTGTLWALFAKLNLKALRVAWCSYILVRKIVDLCCC